MLSTAIWLSALALGVAGAALALAVVGLAGRKAGPAPSAQEGAEEEQEALMRQGIANLMGYAPQEYREGEV